MNRTELTQIIKPVAPIHYWFPSDEDKHLFFQSIREHKSHRAYVQEIKEEAQRLERLPVMELPFSLFQLFSETGSRKEYETPYFQKRRCLNTFAIMTLLEPDKKEHLVSLQEVIWSICNEHTWCLPAHFPEVSEKSESLQIRVDKEPIDLFAAETAFALAEIAVLLRSELEPKIRMRIEEEVRKRVLQPFYHHTYHWEKADHNWAAVCAGSIGSAAIYMVDDHEELSVILERVLYAMDAYLSGFHDDGACLEGYGYWQYGFGFFVYFADLLKKKTNGKIDLMQSEKVHQIALFQQKIFLTSNRIVNFSDSLASGKVWIGLTHYLRQSFPDIDLPKEEWRASYMDDHCSRWAPAIREILWLREDFEGMSWTAKSYLLEQAQWFVSRYQMEGEMYAFATKGGHNDEPHNHNDIGQWIVASDDDVFLSDIGSGEYTKRYFSDDRYLNLCTGSQGHSVPIIDGQYQCAGALYRASSFRVKKNERRDQIELFYAGAYEVDGLRELTRSFTWMKEGLPILLVEDAFFAERKISFIDRFITPLQTTQKEPGNVVLKGKKQQLRIVYDEHQLTVKEKVLTYSNHFAKEEQVLALDFHLNNPTERGNIKFTCLFEEKG
ncbi:heparinase II/III family protein [Bacillus sp. JCM 19034]|uniref:heparinase II/III domain-containing protein n=1 Tax=Bacillus sp. JCM 19034 TaxID=1481928 RepID=UPI0007804BA2|nr:heparinase II/III family protein [Bacillus sp. JCM 19034]